ncbi:MAG: hypothetical protein JWP63_788 [Candidatus Solibacter sp.]|nr:hypothetical protein [Candidatus Solibacter sp.]
MARSGVSVDIAGVAAFNPVLDAADKTQRDGNIVKFLVGKYEGIAELCREAWPARRPLLSGDKHGWQS